MKGKKLYRLFIVAVFFIPAVIANGISETLLQAKEYLTHDTNTD